MKLFKNWLSRRAAKRASKGDSPEKAGERKTVGGQPTVTDNANKAGVGGFISGGF